jgi:hypothetical protein
VEFVDISSQVVELSIPDSWLYEVDRPDDEGLPNGDPLEGILVSVDGNLNDTIYIFESVGHYNTQGEYFVKTFELDTGLSGLMYFLFYEENIEMQVIFEDGFKGVSINMAVETFLDYESEIYYVLKSIRYLE